MTKFRYVGDEYTEIFGFKWRPGDVHDVDEKEFAHAHGKLSNSVLFERLDGKSAAPKIERVADVENDMDPPDDSGPDHLPRLRGARSRRT